MLKSSSSNLPEKDPEHEKVKGTPLKKKCIKGKIKMSAGLELTQTRCGSLCCFIPLLTVHTACTKQKCRTVVSLFNLKLKTFLLFSKSFEELLSFNFSIDFL